jgi:hypothetical protein
MQLRSHAQFVATGFAAVSLEDSWVVLSGGERVMVVVVVIVEVVVGVAEESGVFVKHLL